MSIITHISSLEALVGEFDNALVALENASGHWETTMLNTEDLDVDQSQQTPEERIELLKLIENYTIMAGFLIDHPLLALIKQIREESRVEAGSPVMKAFRHDIQRGETYRHYKGDHYTIVCVAKHANVPQLDMITYTKDNKELWCLPVHEFCKIVKNQDDVEVWRFALVSK